MASDPEKIAASCTSGDYKIVSVELTEKHELILVAMQKDREEKADRDFPSDGFVSDYADILRSHKLDLVGFVDAVKTKDGWKYCNAWAATPRVSLGLFAASFLKWKNVVVTTSNKSLLSLVERYKNASPNNFHITNELNCVYTTDFSEELDLGAECPVQVQNDIKNHAKKIRDEMFSENFLIRETLRSIDVQNFQMTDLAKLISKN